MRKYIYFILLGLFFIGLPVSAKEYELNELIPINESATVKTEKFDYIDFSLNSNRNNVIQFTSIHNNTLSKNPVSINILLFDQEEKNIGFVTYCSNKDYDSSYSGFQLGGGESSSFAITIASKYFGDSGKTVEDIHYITVMDENKFCRIGGYSNYLGKTMKQILNPEEEKSSFDFPFQLPKLPKSFSFLENSRLISYALVGFCALLFFIGLGILFNSLHQKMYGKKTIFAYLPITDIYISIKTVFGKIVAIIFFICVVISGVLFYFNIRIALYIMGILWFISILLIIVKLITKNYDLFYFEPAMDTSLYEKNSQSFGNLNNNSNPLDLSYKENVQNISSDDNISSGAVKASEETKKEESSLNLDDNNHEEGLDDFF